MPFRNAYPYDFTILASAARTATASSDVFLNPNRFEGLRVFIDVTAITDTPSVVFSIEVQDPVSETWKTLLDSAAVTADETHIVMTVAPGATSTANVSLGSYIGRKFRVTATHADSDSITYSVGGEWLAAC